jgi:predicted membrane chloride channel (bestrophin family)
MKTYKPAELIKELLIITMLFTILVAMVFTFIESEAETSENPITFPAEDIRCVQQDGKIVWCESYEAWRVE